MGAAPSIPTDPSRTLQVIGAGYSRTGTVSMQMALEILLKGPVLHGGTQLITRDDEFCKKWYQAYQSRSQPSNHAQTLKLVRDVTRGFVGTTDLPTIDFIPEMLELYPDAKVVLVKRDPDSWWRSTNVIKDNVGMWWLYLVLWPIPGWRWLPSLIGEFAKGMMGTKMSKGTPGPHALANYYEWVRSVTPPEKLLEMELKEGWEPLCNFLGVPVPNVPFPRANDAAAVENTAKSVLARVGQVWLGMLAGAGGTVYLGLQMWRRYR